MVRDPSAVDPLTAIMNAPANHLYLRFFAAESLGRIGHRASVAPLTVIMDAEVAPPVLRCHAATALATLLRKLNTSD